MNDEILKKYQRRFINILTKPDPDYKDKGDILELFIALRDFSKNVLLYEDVPDDIKNKYSLTYKDTGIDLIQLDYPTRTITEIIQCKNYSRRLSHHKLGTFYYWILKLHEFDKNIKTRLVINDKTRYNGELTNLNIEIISSSDIYKYIKSNFESIPWKLSEINDFMNFMKSSSLEILNKIKDSLDKINLILSNSESNSIKIVINPNDIDEVCYFDSITNGIEMKKNTKRNNIINVILLTILTLLMFYFIQFAMSIY